MKNPLWLFCQRGFLSALEIVQPFLQFIQKPGYMEPVADGVMYLYRQGQLGMRRHFAPYFLASSMAWAARRMPSFPVL